MRYNRHGSVVGGFFLMGLGMVLVVIVQVLSMLPPHVAYVPDDPLRKSIRSLLTALAYVDVFAIGIAVTYVFLQAFASHSDRLDVTDANVRDNTKAIKFILDQMRARYGPFHDADLHDKFLSGAGDEDS